MTELVTDYLEGRQSMMQRLRFHMHLGMCRHCRTYVRQMKSTIDSIGALGDSPAPPPVSPELLERFRNWRR
ncbi:MAG: zf-HC2 domain-containing protein [Vicinamibacterales bacterium]